MSDYPKIFLRRGKEVPVRRRHPWIFSGAIQHLPDVKPGDLVEVADFNGEVLGYGFFESGSLAVKLFSFGEPPVGGFWERKLRRALMLRKQTGLVDQPGNNAYRLIFSEGDGMPGLIIDIYGSTAVIQANSAGMYSLRQHLAGCLKEIYGDSLSAIYDKSSETMRKQAALVTTDGFLAGSECTTRIEEHGCLYDIDIAGGQKTGFFLDQRDNRELLYRLAAGKRVLNTYCYTGGFSVAALKGGAVEVHSVDSSRRAITLTEQNLVLNGYDPQIHKCHAVDAMHFLDTMESVWDLIVLDPPAFAKHISQRHKALSAYRHINREAFKKITHGGFLFTFSCSQVVDKEQFTSIVMAAAIEADRLVKIIRYLGHPADHPVSICHPEGTYLKGLLLYVE
ncbi:MAG: class I SAM-dependent rRNA methyltransferase [Bacteroidales bacterium]|nr:class I SAM-dependent rRNA methyltransferase [Bacteroidales bacterium]MDD3664202.1 class I SAM-dependent rRNA methyltransferase [Bacteroidales bacterium]